jgi:hypothetical protein
MSLISSTIFFVQLRMMQSTDTEGKGKNTRTRGPFMAISITPANINSTAANWTTFRTAENAIKVRFRVTSINIDNQNQPTMPKTQSIMPPYKPVPSPLNQPKPNPKNPKQEYA